MGNDPGADYRGGWVGPRAGLDVMKKINIFSPYRESKPDSSVVQRCGIL
jgi:hypothetical protein